MVIALKSEYDHWIYGIMLWSWGIISMWQMGTLEVGLNAVFGGRRHRTWGIILGGGAFCITEGEGEVAVLAQSAGIPEVELA